MTQTQLAAANGRQLECLCYCLGCLDMQPFSTLLSRHRNTNKQSSSCSCKVIKRRRRRCLAIKLLQRCKQASAAIICGKRVSQL